MSCNCLQKNAAVSVVKVLLSKINNTEVSLTPMIQYAPNSNHEKQLTFRSTRKRRQLATNSISKPSQAQVLEQRKKLKEEEPIFCGVCFQENDSSCSNTITWVQCSKCAMWIHNTCTDTPSCQDEHYMCQYCLP